MNIHKRIFFAAILLFTTAVNANDPYAEYLQNNIEPPKDINKEIEIALQSKNLENLEDDMQQKEEKNKPPTIREEAFKQLLNKTVPLKPEQIIELRKKLDETKRAEKTLPSTPPQPISSTLTVDLSPGTPSPVIRLATGFVSSIVFVDRTGQPWPIGDFSLGDPRSFNIQWDQKTNALFIQNTAPYASTNLAIRLANLDTPITLSLVTGQKEVDFRLDLQVLANGPNAQTPVVNDSLPNSASPMLVSVLDGVPPQNSIELKVSGNEGRAWLYNGKILFRTKLTLLSPAWSATVSSQDGTKVYEIIKTPLILASIKGKPVKIMISGI